MKNLTKKQIEAVKRIDKFAFFKYHGNRKTVSGIPLDYVKIIKEKQLQRQFRKIDNSIESPVQITLKLIEWSKKCKGTSYFKIMIEGNTGIYYASPSYGHSDYNKSRLFDKTTKNIRLMDLFNSIVNK